MSCCPCSSMSDLESHLVSESEREKLLSEFKSVGKKLEKGPLYLQTSLRKELENILRTVNSNLEEPTSENHAITGQPQSALREDQQSLLGSNSTMGPTQPKRSKPKKQNPGKVGSKKELEDVIKQMTKRLEELEKELKELRKKLRDTENKLAEVQTTLDDEQEQSTTIMNEKMDVERKFSELQKEYNDLNSRYFFKYRTALSSIIICIA